MPQASTPDPELAAALCVIREERGLTREELAQRSGVSSEALARIESAQVAPPLEVVQRLVHAVGVGLVEVCPPNEWPASRAVGLHGGARRRQETHGGIQRR